TGRCLAWRAGLAQQADIDCLGQGVGTCGTPGLRAMTCPRVHMRFVHAADLHIDSPLCGLERYEGAPLEQIRRATRRATENLVQLCLDEQAELLLLAGDLYDDDWRDYSTGLFFQAQMSRLNEAGIQV